MLWDCIFRLLLAGVLGGVIGWDREYRAKEAGLRTHFLVALGSALIMIVSQYGFADVLAKPGYGLDPSRVAAQVDTIGQTGVDENQKPNEDITINSVSIETYQ